ncbi:MAG: hypothetical protein ABL984_00455 [Pyrinomonadaceae bacterium]
MREPVRYPTPGYFRIVSGGTPFVVKEENVVKREDDIYGLRPTPRPPSFFLSLAIGAVRGLRRVIEALLRKNRS